MMIAEETSGFPGVTVPTFEGGLGFDMKLGVHMQSRIRNFFRTPYEERGQHEWELLYNLNEMQQNGRWMTAHSHDDAAAGAPNRHSTLYGSLPTLDAWQKFADTRLFHAWNLLSPGCGHAIHMGDEIGQKWPWNEQLHAPEGAVEWHLLENHPESALHRGLQECVGDLNRFYRSRQAFWKHGGHGFQLISHDASNRVIGIRRLDYEGERIVLFFNFSLQGYTEYDFPLSHEDPDRHRIKDVREVFNTDGVQYGGSGQLGNTWAYIRRDANEVPTHYRFAFPALAMVAFQESLK